MSCRLLQLPTFRRSVEPPSSGSTLHIDATTPIHYAGNCLKVDKIWPNVPKDLTLYHEYGGNIQTASNTITYSGLKNHYICKRLSYYKINVVQWRLVEPPYGRAGVGLLYVYEET